MLYLQLHYTNSDHKRQTQKANHLTINNRKLAIEKALYYKRPYEIIKPILILENQLFKTRK